MTAWSFYQSRQYPEAISKAQQIIDLDRYYPQGHLQLGNALLEVGETDKGLAALRESVRLMPGIALPMCLLCFALVAASRREEAEAVRDEMLSMAAKAYVKTYFLAMAYLALGDHDKTLKYLADAVSERDPWLVWLGTEPKLDPLRKVPRFIELFRETRNPMALK